MLTIKQIKKRIQHRLEDYALANAGPIAIPRGTVGARLPATIDVDFFKDTLSEASKENTILNTHALKRVLSDNECIALNYRLKGYTIEEVARFMCVAQITVKKYLQRVREACEEVNA